MNLILLIVSVLFYSMTGVTGLIFIGTSILITYFGALFVKNRKLVLAAVIALLLSGVIEVLQALMECGRSGEWLDWMANMTGIVVGVILGRKWGCEKILPFVSR